MFRSGAAVFGRRLLIGIVQVVIVAWATYTISFLLVLLLPGDPVREFVVANYGVADDRIVPLIASYYGYDKPPFERYFLQLGGLFAGDLGYSLSARAPVGEVIGAAWWSTFSLGSLSVLIAAAVALGGVSAIYIWSRRGALATITRLLPVVLSALPTFLVAIVVLRVLAVDLRVMSLFPNGSFLGLFVPAAVLSTVILPVLWIATQARISEVQGRAFVLSALAAGRSRGWVFFREIVPNVLGTFTTVVGLSFAAVFSGALVTETVFSRGGLGKVIVEAVNTKDFSLLQGVVFLLAAVFAVINVVVDLAQASFDLRIRRVEAAETLAGSEAS